MAIGKEVRTKIASIGSTQKITRAMEMVAASKMKKGAEEHPFSKMFAKVIQRTISDTQSSPRCLVPF